MKKSSIFVACLLGAVAAATGKPNLVVIMADDLGYADVGFNGSTQIPTPHIDSIAANGIRFSSGYTSYSVCGPSRAGFITGRYQQRFGFERNPVWNLTDSKSALPLSEMTIADSLSAVGYHCGLIGKWHLGAEPSLRPNKRGFHEFFGHLGGGKRYFASDLTIKNTEDVKDEEDSYRSWITRNDTPVKTDKYLTDAFSDEGVRFIEHNQSKPFFLFLSYNAPHGPLQATEKYLARFPTVKDKKRRTYCAMVSALDDGVGRVLAALRKTGLEDNTMIVFLSDNGGPESKNSSDNGPLRGSKSDVWEGGYRVPFAIQYKGTLKAGQTYDHPVSSLDVFATISALTNSPVDPKRPLDGANLMPFLTGKKNGLPHDALYLRKFDQGRYAVRQGDYKLVIPNPNAKPQLYNLANDLGEKTNLAAQHPERLARLDAIRRQWDAELIEPIFMGLLQTPKWKAKLARQKKAKSQK